MRRALVIASLLSILLAACGGGGSGKSEGSATAQGFTPERGGTVVRHIESDCKTLNWVLFTTNDENYVLRYVYDYLLDYDENLNIVPVLAESYDVEDDGLRITVELRDSLFWHDGEPITAKDVAFTVEKIRDPAVPAVNKAGWFSNLDRVETKGDNTVVFIWSKPYAPALHALTQIAPIPEHVYGKGDFLSNPANRAPVGSGAFKFDEWRGAQSISLVRNDDYYAGRAYLDRIVFRVIPESASALNALRAGEIDEMRVRQEQWEVLLEDDDFKKRYDMPHYYVPQYNYLAWNCRTLWFSDKRVRAAMTMLFDRGEIIDELYSGYSKPVSGPFYVNSSAYDKTIAPLPYDPAAAKRLLDEAGWIDTDGDGVRDKDGADFAFDFNVASGSRIAMNFAQILQESCKKAGIDMRIRPLEGATFFDKVFKGEYEAAALAWRLDNDPDIYDTFHSSQIPPLGLNHCYYSNAEVDRLLEAARAEFDPVKRNDMYHQVHRLIHEDQPYTFVNSVPEKRPINKRIGNVLMSPQGPFNFYPGAIYWYLKEPLVEAKN